MATAEGSWNIRTLHSANIVVHVATGVLALLLGLVAIGSRKGARRHVRSGQLFLLAICFVVATGLIGVFVFGRNTFLLVITVLSGYQAFSGYRVLQHKSNQPHLLDIAVAIGSLAVTLYFLYYFRSIGMIWSPVIIYSTVGALVLLVIYDLVRYVIPRAKYRKLWLYEHIYKMIGAFTALLAAFTGTVFVDHQPYSQILPSSLGVTLQLGFITYHATRRRGLRSETPPARRADAA